MFLISKTSLLTTTLLAFAVLAFSYRWWEVFFKKQGIHGKIYHSWTLHILAFFHIVLGVFSLLEYWYVERKYDWMVGFIGFTVFALGHFFRFWAIRSLGQWYSTQIELKPNQPLIRTGAYFYSRNPYYLGVMLEVGATPFIFNAYGTILLFLFSYMPILIFRMVKEEEMFEKHFGSLFLDYQRKVPRLIPKVSLRKNL